MNTELRTRYPGLASFTTAQKDLFFGRKQETRDLFNLISVERTVVLFSKSGYGKTSLLQAGVMPLLYGQLMTPVPVRFGTDALTPEQHFSIQYDTAWLKFQGKSEAEAQKQARDTSASETFWAQISRYPFGAPPAQFTPLFIFDQFEELFTLYPDRAQRQRFVGELADLIHENMPAALRERILADLDSGKISDDEAARLEKAPPMRFVFSIRSDMLHFMDELSEPIPYILRSRYQLFGLNQEQAQEAIVSPAQLGGSVGATSSFAITESSAFASPPFNYAPEALEQILQVLSKNREVESFQLQAVCQAIEEKIIASTSSFEGREPRHISFREAGFLVTPSFYGNRAGINNILEESYNRRIEDLAVKDPAWPEVARRLMEDVLVNQNERRKSVDVVEIQATLGTSMALLEELERQRLLRREPRLDSFYYEISHDTWLAPIVKSRKARQVAEGLSRIAQEKVAADYRRRRALFVSFMAGALVVAVLISIYYAFRKNREAAIEKENAQQAEQRAAVAEIEADSATTHASTSRRIAEKQSQLANLASKKAKTAEDFAKQKKLEAEIVSLKNKALIEANQLIASKKLPQNFDALIAFDSLNFSSWNIDSISSEIGKLQKLRTLDLNSNRLSNLPKELGNLQTLQKLYVKGNQLNNVPRELGNLQNLQMLDLSSNQLSNLPMELGKLQKLQTLYLRSNQLSSLPQELGNLKNLQKLYLNVNKLSSVPGELGKLQNLQTLFLKGNQLSSVPQELGNLENLQTLYLSDNQLTSVPGELGNLQNLRMLDLSSNKLSNLPEELGNLHKLQRLPLNSNELSSLPGELGNLQNLQELDLSSNQLASVPGELGKLQNLRKLNLSANQLSWVPAELGNLQNLEELDLSSNQLTSIPGELGNLQNLNKLNLRSNQLSSAPLELAKLSKLRNLDLIGNPISKEAVEALRQAMPGCRIVWK